MLAEAAPAKAGEQQPVQTQARVEPRHALAVIVLLGAALRLVPLGRQSLWLDEAFSYWTARQPTLELLQYLWAVDTHGPIHYLMLQPMLALGGSEWLLRLPSALAGIASLVLIYALGAELFGKPTGLLAALVLALTPIHLWFSQEARMYAVVAMFTLAAAWFAVRALRRGRAADWVLLGVCQGLALLTDTGAVWFTFAVNAAALFLLGWLWRTRRFWPWVGAQALALLMYSPWLSTFMSGVRRGSAGWIPPATVTVFIRTVADLAGSFERPTLEAVASLLLLLAVLVLGGRALWRDAAGRRPGYVLLVCWLVVPLGMAFVISQPYVRPALITGFFGEERSVFLTRNLIIASFPLYLLLARAVLLAGRRTGAGLLAALVVLNGVAYAGNTFPARKVDFRGAAALVEAQLRPGDVIVFSPFFLERPFDYYYWQPGQPVPRPADFEDGVIDAGRTEYADLTAALGEHARAWVIRSDNIFYRDTRDTLAVVEAHGERVEQWPLFGTSVALYALETEAESEAAAPR